MITIKLNVWNDLNAVKLSKFIYKQKGVYH